MRATGTVVVFGVFYCVKMSARNPKLVVSTNCQDTYLLCADKLRKASSLVDARGDIIVEIHTVDIAAFAVVGVVEFQGAFLLVGAVAGVDDRDRVAVWNPDLLTATLVGAIVFGNCGEFELVCEGRKAGRGSAVVFAVLAGESEEVDDRTVAAVVTRTVSLVWPPR